MTRIPVEHLWDNSGDLPAKRTRDLTKSGIRDLLVHARVRFVIADVGRPLTWIPVEQCFDFWKRDVQLHVSDAAPFPWRRFRTVLRTLLQNGASPMMSFASCSWRCGTERRPANLRLDPTWARRRVSFAQGSCRWRLVAASSFLGSSLPGAFGCLAPGGSSVIR